MVFQSPQWFFLIPAFAAVGWYWSGLKLWTPFRALALLLIVLILADPQVQQLKRGMDLWVLVDRSESSLDLVDQNFDEWRRLLQRAKPTKDDELHFVNFAGEVVEQAGGETLTFAGNPGYTRSRLALESATALLKPDRHARLLMFTDGYSTEPLGDMGDKLKEIGVPLDYRLVQPPEATDYRVVSVDIPTRKRLGEPFLVEITIRGNEDGEIPIQVSRNNLEPLEQTVAIKGGLANFQFMTRIGSAGAHKYKVSLPIQDAYHGNNTFESWIEVTSGPRVVLVTRYLNDPVAEILSAQGFEVETVSDPSTLQVGQLTGAKVVILNNVPAYEIPQQFLNGLQFFVRSQGGGLLMVGGNHSFAAGGYYESTIDDLLPVSMELKAEHRKLAVAMAIVLDRSGSMSAGVPGGRTKMDLANEGAARAVELLGNFDQVTVYAVDSSPHEEVPLLMVGPNRDKISSRIRRIGSMGGGIFVYTGLSAAWKSLQNSPVGQRHIILFSDAADSEEPDRYKQLLSEMQAEGATVSVIGLGTKTDVDAGFLEDIAKRGNGRIFFTDNPGYIPNIFAQETATVARSLFVKEEVPVNPTGMWQQISPNAFDWLPQVDGYNLSYARPEATVSVISGDEYNAPMVATVQRGIGRAAAVSFPLGGESSESVRSWAKVGDFVQTLTRWLMGETLPPGLGMRTDVDGTEFTLDLLHDDSWTEKLSTPPRIFMAETGSFDEVREITWRRLAPGHFQAKTQLEHGTMARGAIQIGNIALPFGPIAVGGSPEWAFDATRVEELKQTAIQSGGSELVDLSKAWQRPQVQEYASIQPWLLTVLLIFILADALFTRMGWQTPRFAGAGKIVDGLKPKARPRRKVAQPSVSTDEQPAELEQPVQVGTEEEEPDAAESAETRRSRFDRAKRRR